MRDADNVRKIAELQPDYMGFIFHDSSPRCCRGISPDVIKDLPYMGVEPVMVSVDMCVDEIRGLASLTGITTLQLHGLESPEICGMLRDDGFKIWKVMSVKNPDDFGKLRPYAGVVDMFLFDTPTSSYGGSGRRFDWNLLENYNMDCEFMLSGGISADDAGRIKALRCRKLHGIDLNSRFETAYGIKDVALLRCFLSSLRNRK